MENPAVWLIDDDKDDQEMVTEVFNELGLSHPLVFLSSGQEALNMLEKVPVGPFIIIADVNLPKMDGFELRKRMLEHPSKKMHSVPFIFWSTAASEEQVTKAFDLSAHGFFIKEPNFEELKATFVGIIRYWLKSRMPGKR
jgi:CheY-like chemotaxis protein